MRTMPPMPYSLFFSRSALKLLGSGITPRRRDSERRRPHAGGRMNRVKEIERINAKDLQLQLAADTVGNAGVWDVNKSWHAQYKDSAYVYVGGLADGLSEGDVIVICSQFGEVVDVNMPRDRKTGKTKGFAFVCYEVRAPQPACPHPCPE